MIAAEKHNHILRFHRFQKSREKYFAPLIFKAIRSQYDYFLGLLKSGHTEHSALDKISSSAIIKVLKPLYLDAGIVYGAKIRADLNKLIPSRLSFQAPLMLKRFPTPMSETSTLITPNSVELKARMPMGFSETMRQLIEQYFSLDILNQSEGITDTTRELIRQVFTDAYEKGEGIEDIVKKLENTELSRIRSRLIARTETVTAANAGALIVAKSTGLDLNKEWLSASDNRVRKHHQHLNGQVVELDGYFSDHGVTMKIPGARVQKDGSPVPVAMVANCRCTTLFIPVD